jgi:rhodanese-related sulfurtransferase
MVATVSRKELKRKIDEHATIMLIEALPAQDYRKGHLPGAIDMPPDRVKEIAPESLPDKNAEIIVYCASSTCNASQKAADALVALGYKNVRKYEGGKADWMQAGLQLESGG